jgi:Secretion system C-terminal sorting domain
MSFKFRTNLKLRRRSIMKFRITICLLLGLMITGMANAGAKYQGKAVAASQDTIFIDGGTLSGGENAGSMETAINGDTLTGGARVNPNRVYALYEGQVYYQLAPINVFNPTGTLIIVGVPDPAKPAAKAKPIILIQPTAGTDVIINVGAVNQVYGSIKFDNVHYQTMQMDGYQNNELFYCGTANQLKQTLTINNCLFEFSNIDLFDCTNESGAIGGWPYGASFFITNSYFRNLFFAGQWWGSRVFQCKHPIDTLWVENNTITTGGLTFLQQNELSDWVYINHNTIVNNKKYWLLSPYRHNEFITNNIFINQNWVGEDTNVTNSGQDPDKLYMSTINIDTNNTTNGLIVNPQYMVGGDTNNISPDLAFGKMRVFISNNINYNDPALTSGYYTSATYKNDTTGTPPSYLNWAGAGSGPWKIGNMPGEWMNTRTQALFTQFDSAHGGAFIEHNTITSDPQTVTPGIASAAVVTMMAGWNQNQWGDQRYSTAPDIVHSAYIYGDYDPTTLPGIVGGAKTDGVTSSTTLASGDQLGVAKFSDLTESFKQTAHLSDIDNLPIGSLIWDDAQNAAYNSAAAWQAVKAQFNSMAPPALQAVRNPTGVPGEFKLSQNYPNPFNPTTQIVYSVPARGFVSLKVYNVLGQEVATLFAGQQAPGQHFVTFNGSKFASGVYFYRLQAAGSTLTMKMVLVK